MTSDKPSILVLHGPNLNLLGLREPEIYGSTTLAELDMALIELGVELGCSVRCVQHNGEGELITAIHASVGRDAGIVFNPGGYTHTSVALHDAIRGVPVPTIEVHLSNIHTRESFRRESVTGAACLGMIAGFGVDSYRLGLRQLATHARRRV